MGRGGVGGGGVVREERMLLYLGCIRRACFCPSFHALVLCTKIRAKTRTYTEQAQQSISRQSNLHTDRQASFVIIGKKEGILRRHS